MDNLVPPKPELRSPRRRLSPLLIISFLLVPLLVLPLILHARHPPARHPPALPASSLEIRLVGSAVDHEGIGAVLSGLKPVLLLANYTGAVITMRDRTSFFSMLGIGSPTGHGYSLKRYLRLGAPLPFERVTCDHLADPVHILLDRIANECDRFNASALVELGIFNNCNTLLVDRYLGHPRGCMAHSAPLIRAATTFDIDPHPEKTDVCFLRRGGDVEERIRAGKGNLWAIDEARSKPILAAVKAAAANVVVITETKYENDVRNVYSPDVLSNKEDLEKVVAHLQKCRCTFIAAVSSFAAAMMQIAPPDFIVYTESRDGFKFEAAPYPYKEEYGDRAVPLGRGTDAITELCAPR